MWAWTRPHGGHIALAAWVVDVGATMTPVKSKNRRKGEKRGRKRGGEGDLLDTTHNRRRPPHRRLHLR
jgi:hypothetical protein